MCTCLPCCGKSTWTPGLMGGVDIAHTALHLQIYFTHTSLRNISPRLLYNVRGLCNNHVKSSCPNLQSQALTHPNKVHSMMSTLESSSHKPIYKCSGLRLYRIPPHCSNVPWLSLQNNHTNKLNDILKVILWSNI